MDWPNEKAESFALKSLGVVLAGHVLILTILAASPHLHEKIHSDPGQANHICVITVFSSGFVEHSQSSVDISDFFMPEAWPVKISRVFICGNFIGNTRQSRSPPNVSQV